MQQNASPHARTPKGVAKPVAARLMPHERHELEAIAQREHRSCSAMMRVIFLRGLDSYRLENETAS